MFLSVMIDVVYITNCFELDKRRKVEHFHLLSHEKHVAQPSNRINSGKKYYRICKDNIILQHSLLREFPLRKYLRKSEKGISTFSTFQLIINFS